MSDADVEAAKETLRQAGYQIVDNVKPEIGQPAEAVGAPIADMPQPPPGKAPLRSLEDAERLPDAEFHQRVAEVQAVMRAQGQE